MSLRLTDRGSAQYLSTPLLTKLQNLHICTSSTHVQPSLQRYREWGRKGEGGGGSRLRYPVESSREWHVIQVSGDDQSVAQHQTDQAPASFLHCIIVSISWHGACSLMGQGGEEEEEEGGGGVRGAGGAVGEGWG